MNGLFIVTSYLEFPLVLKPLILSRLIARLSMDSDITALIIISIFHIMSLSLALSDLAPVIDLETWWQCR